MKEMGERASQPTIDVEQQKEPDYYSRFLSNAIIRFNGRYDFHEHVVTTDNNSLSVGLVQKGGSKKFGLQIDHEDTLTTPYQISSQLEQHGIHPGKIAAAVLYTLARHNGLPRGIIKEASKYAMETRVYLDEGGCGVYLPDANSNKMVLVKFDKEDLTDDDITDAKAIIASKYVQKTLKHYFNHGTQAAVISSIRSDEKGEKRVIVEAQNDKTYGNKFSVSVKGVELTAITVPQTIEQLADDSRGDSVQEGTALPEKEKPKSLEAHIGGYRDQIALLGPTADGGLWRDTVMDKIITEQLTNELAQEKLQVAVSQGLSADDANVIRLATRNIKQKYFFDPVINQERSGRDWGKTPTGEDFDDASLEAENIMDDAVAAFYFDGKVDPKYSGVGSLAEGVGTVAATTIMRGKKLVVLIEPSDEGVPGYIKNAREQARKDLAQMAKENPGNIIVAESFEDLAQKMWAARLEMLQKQQRYPEKVTVPLDVKRRTATIEYKNNERGELDLQNLICISGSSKPDAQVHNQLLQYWKAQGMPVSDMRRPDFTLDVYGREEVAQKFVSYLNVVTVEPDRNGNYTSYNAVKDLGNAMARVVAADPPTYTILYMPEDAKNPKSDYARARKLVIAQHQRLCAEFPELAQYIKITTTAEEVENHSQNIMGKIPREQWTQIAETPDTRNKPENFRTDGERGYYPDRIIQETPRLRLLNELIAEVGVSVPQEQREKVAKRLHDLLLYNAYANIFAPVHSAGDALGVPDEISHAGEIREKLGDADLSNCVTLILRREDGTLAPAGGFAELGESPSQTIGRELKEETRGEVEHAAFIGVLSRPDRGSRKFPIVSPVSGLTLDPTQLHDTESDAAKVVVLKLFDENGNFLFDENVSGINYSRPGTYTNLLTGQTFEHNGMFDHHDETLRKLYDYWQTYGKGKGWTLSETVKKMSQYTPQAAFHEFEPRDPKSENYRQVQIKGKFLTMTPNLQFAYTQTTRILTEAGLQPDEAATQALEFVYEASTSKIEIDDVLENAELLPQYPLPSVTVDCLVLTQDEEGRECLLVEETERGHYRLPGTFYGPEYHQSNMTLEQQATSVVREKFGAQDFTVQAYAGPVGGEFALTYDADSRYPRLSHVFVGNAQGDVDPSIIQGLRPGSKLVKIPIHDEGAPEELSRQLRYSYWDFDHGFEIVHPLLPRALKLLELQH